MFLSSRSESILFMYLCLCMITTPPLLSTEEMITFGFWIRLDSACIYLSGRNESFCCETEARIIPWMKPLEKSVSQVRFTQIYHLSIFCVVGMSSISI